MPRTKGRLGKSSRLLTSSHRRQSVRHPRPAVRPPPLQFVLLLCRPSPCSAVRPPPLPDCPSFRPSRGHQQGRHEVSPEIEARSGLCCRPGQRGRAVLLSGPRLTQPVRAGPGRRKVTRSPQRADSRSQGPCKGDRKVRCGRVIRSFLTWEVYATHSRIHMLSYHIKDLQISKSI